MRALVLSAGGMFGAYQAGVWQGLAEWFKPDIVGGASIGGLNGWAIAGGCRPEELVSRWLDLGELCSWRLRAPGSPLDGVFDCEIFERIVRRMHSEYQPKVAYGVVLTDLMRAKPRLFTDDIHWEHLAASCAVPFFLRHHRIGGRLYTDGGLLHSLPVWAAAEMGASSILAVQALPFMPSRVVRTFVKGVRWLAPKPPRPRPAVNIVTLTAGPLGRARDMLLWNRKLALQWIEQGEAEAAQKKHSLQKMFWG